MASLVTGHAQVHADLGALAVEVGHQLIEDELLVLLGDIGVRLDGLAVDAVLGVPAAAGGIVGESRACARWNAGDGVPYGCISFRCTQPPTTAVIARRAKPDVAISWQAVRQLTQYQEIPSLRSE